MTINFAKPIVTLMAGALLAGCASQAALQSRNALREGCGAGNVYSCTALPYAQAQVDREVNENGARFATGLLLGVAAVADAYSESRRPAYVFVPVRACRWC